LNNLSKNLNYLRRRQGLKQEEMRPLLGFSRSTWSNYENGLFAPSIKHLERIARYFGLSMSELLEKDLESLAPPSEKLRTRKTRGRSKWYSVNEKVSYVEDGQMNFELVWKEIEKLREDINALKQTVRRK